MPQLPPLVQESPLAGVVDLLEPGPASDAVAADLALEGIEDGAVAEQHRERVAAQPAILRRGCAAMTVVEELANRGLGVGVDDSPEIDAAVGDPQSDPRALRCGLDLQHLAGTAVEELVAGPDGERALITDAERIDRGGDDEADAVAA